MSVIIQNNECDNMTTIIDMKSVTMCNWTERVAYEFLEAALYECNHTEQRM